MLKLIDKCLSAVENVVINTRISINKRDTLERRLTVALAALSRIKDNIEIEGGISSKSIAIDAIKEIKTIK